jgi:hypothetical protein
VRIQISYVKACTGIRSIGQKKIALDGNTCHFGKYKKNSDCREKDHPHGVALLVEGLLT